MFVHMFCTLDDDHDIMTIFVITQLQLFTTLFPLMAIDNTNEYCWIYVNANATD